MKPVELYFDCQVPFGTIERHSFNRDLLCSRSLNQYFPRLVHGCSCVNVSSLVSHLFTIKKIRLFDEKRDLELYSFNSVIYRDFLF